MPVAARSRHLALFSVTGLLSQRNALRPRCLSWRQRSCVLEGLLQVATLFSVWSVACRIHTLWCGVSQFAVARRLVWRRVRSEYVASHPGVALPPSEHWRTHLRCETDTCATSKSSTLISFTEPAFFGLLPLRVYESTQCVSVHPGTAELDSFFFFRYRNVGTVRSRSCSSPVFCGMWTSLAHLHLPLRTGRLFEGERGR